MPTIPVYNREVSLQPQFTQGIDVRATPEAFGAATGRGLQDVGQGIDRVAQAKFTLEQKLQENSKRAAQIRTENEVNTLLLDPDNGILNRTGTNAVGAGKAFQTEVEKLRAEGSKGLQGQALTDYNLYFDQMIVDRSATVLRHEATEVKKAVDQSYVSLADTYSENAATYSGDPAASRRYIDEGVKVLMERAVTFGIDDATRDNGIAEYVRNAHKTVAMTIATTDPLAAQAYLDSNREELGAGFYEALTGELKPAVTIKQADQAAAGFFAQPSDAAAGDGTEPDEGPPADIAAQTATTGLPLVAGKNAISITNLDGGFASSLERMLADMPEDLRGQVVIYSGWRPSTRAEAPEGYVGQTQDEIFAAAVAKYGSEAAARKYAAPPGKSNHNRGQAADLKYGSEAAKEWIHANAAKYGLSFPMAHEPWHIEPASARDGSGAPAQGGGSGGYMDQNAIEAYVATLPQDVQGMVRDSIYARYETAAKADTYNRKVATDQIFAHILNNDFQMPTDPALLSAAGMENVAQARKFAEQGGHPTESDPATYLRLTKMKFENRSTFAQADLNLHRTTLSKQDFDTMVADQKAMIQSGYEPLDTKFAFTEAQRLFETRIGPAPPTSEVENRKAYDTRLYLLQQQIDSDMRRFQEIHKVAPTQAEILNIIKGRTLPLIGADDEPDDWFGVDTALQFEIADPETAGFKLEADQVVLTMPVEIRAAIFSGLKAKLGKDPTNEEIAAEYEQFLLWSVADTTDDTAGTVNTFRRGR